MVRLRCHSRKMDPFGNDEIARLLRLKRYEQPPPAYFENFLSEFRRRQRDELLRQPVWRICFERARGFAVQYNVRSLASYAAGIAAVVACAAFISNPTLLDCRLQAATDSNGIRTRFEVFGMLRDSATKYVLDCALRRKMQFTDFA